MRQNNRPARDHRHLTVAEVDELTVAAKDNYRMTRDYRDHPHGLSRTTQEERLF